MKFGSSIMLGGVVATSAIAQEPVAPVPAVSAEAAAANNTAATAVSAQTNSIAKAQQDYAAALALAAQQRRDYENDLKAYHERVAAIAAANAASTASYQASLAAWRKSGGKAVGDAPSPQPADNRVAATAPGGTTAPGGSTSKRVCRSEEWTGSRISRSQVCR